MVLTIAVLNLLSRERSSVVLRCERDAYVGGVGEGGGREGCLLEERLSHAPR